MHPAHRVRWHPGRDARPASSWRRVAAQRGAAPPTVRDGPRADAPAASTVARWMLVVATHRHIPQPLRLWAEIRKRRSARLFSAGLTTRRACARDARRQRSGLISAGGAADEITLAANRAALGRPLAAGAQAARERAGHTRASSCRRTPAHLILVAPDGLPAPSRTRAAEPGGRAGSRGAGAGMVLQRAGQRAASNRSCGWCARAGACARAAVVPALPAGRARLRPRTRARGGSRRLRKRWC